MKKAFTLIELLVVVAIIGILSVLLLPAVQNAMAKSGDAKSASNLRGIGVALNEYASEHDGFYPKATGSVTYMDTNSDPASWSWQQQISDYVGGDKKVFQSPNVPFAEKGYGYYLGSRAAFLETQGFAPVNRLKIREPSKHILGGECVYWWNKDSPTDADKDDYSQTPSFKQDGSTGKKTPVLFADGHVMSFDHFDSASMTARYEGTGDGNTYPWSP